MISNVPQGKRRKYIKEELYNQEYHDCPTPNARNRKMANIASDNGRCWWIYQWIMANSMYRSEDGKNRR